LSKNRILVIDIDPVIRSGICNFLLAHGHLVAEAPSMREAQQQVHKFRPDAAILDFSFPNGDALELLRQIKSMESNIPVIALVGQGSAEAAVRAIQDGAEQFLIKPVELSLLHAVLQRALNQCYRHQSLASIATLKADSIDPFLGTSAAIRRMRELARRVAHSESPILLQGETGSGKGVLANWIHCNGSRAREPFLDLNCAGLSCELLESELFGHEKGAFTSALSAKQGLLEVANRGTVFLDEVGDIDLQIQPRLLKVLEDRVFRRLGDVRDRTVDIRLISATHRELLDLVRQQKFRSDLYFRVNIVPLRVPPLRERVEDIPMLAQHFLARLAHDVGRGEMRLEKCAMEALQSFSWPGNIRELRNVLERAVLLTERNHITAHQLQLQSPTLTAQPRMSGNGTLKQMELAYIHFVLQEEGGSVERAARRLGIARSSLYNKLKRVPTPQEPAERGTGKPEVPQARLRR
jgi:DNA-binding NtrC family response regulator